MKGSCDKEKTAAIFSIQIHHNNSAFNPNLVWGGGGGLGGGWRSNFTTDVGFPLITQKR